MKQVTIVTGLGFGDEGKGTTVDTLSRRCPSPPVVVRHNGGPQAAHNVVLPDGREHTFAQWGSGTFAGARTYLSKHMMINPLNLLKEADHLASQGVTDPYQSLLIAESAPIITPYHVSVNRAREWARGDGRHGSTGQGIGELRRDMLDDDAFMVIRACDLLQPIANIVGLLCYWRDQKQHDLRKLNVSWEDEQVLFGDEMLKPLAEEYQRIGQKLTIVSNNYTQDLLAQGEHLIFEGSQGVLLDESYGFHPYTTWSNTTTDQAYEMLLDADFDPDDALSIGVMRAYGTRHGPGPFVTESPLFDFTERHNGTGQWMGAFRSGWFDKVAMSYSLEVGGHFDALCVTHLDTTRQFRHIPICMGYVAPNGDKWHTLKVNPHSRESQDWLPWQETFTEMVMTMEPEYLIVEPSVMEERMILGLPVYLQSYGPTYEDKQFLGA